MILAGNVIKALKSEELHWYLGIMGAAVAAIAANIYSIYGSVGQALRYSFFQVSSVMTTTGFSTADFDAWPTFSKAVLVLLMFIGASAGSTGGGIKVSRVIILVKTAFKEVRYRINPREVRVIRCDGQVMEQSVVTGVSSYFVVYMILFGISTLILSLDSLGTTDAFTAVAACFNNIGPGLGAVGPSQNYFALTDLSKYVLSVDMLLGRLEIFPLLVLFSPPSWRR
jgi:trk system potassium uptake protein TrkH